jgi:hypothetical protein
MTQKQQGKTFPPDFFPQEAEIKLWLWVVQQENKPVETTPGPPEGGSVLDLFGLEHEDQNDKF